jgi:hypothetical protein
MKRRCLRCLEPVKELDWYSKDSFHHLREHEVVESARQLRNMWPQHACNLAAHGVAECNYALNIKDTYAEV